MTFRSINKAVSKKFNFLEKKDDNEVKLKEYFTDFLEQIYGEIIVAKLNFSLDYKPETRRLTILTNSKIFANDLIFKLGHLTEFMSRKTKEIDQIVIR